MPMGKTKKSVDSDDELSSDDSIPIRNTLPEILYPAMMTVCVYLKNTINLDLVFWCLPITPGVGVWNDNPLRH